jgi:hypothetical protein
MCQTAPGYGWGKMRSKQRRSELADDPTFAAFWLTPSGQ